MPMTIQHSTILKIIIKTKNTVKLFWDIDNTTYKLNIVTIYN